MSTETATTDTIAKTCLACGASFTCDFPALSRYVHECPDCIERKTAQSQHRAVVDSAAARRTRWQSVCPHAYLATDPARLPLPHRLADVLAWRYSERGLMLHGDTGLGKSRCAWLLMRQEYLAFRSIRVLDCAAGIKYAAKFGDSTKAAAQWIDDACETDLLLLDDTFKAKLTDSFESALFAIVALRGEAGLPIIVTGNDDPNTLAARMTPDRRGPLIRRLAEMTAPIAFTP